MAIEIGKLRHRIEIQSCTTSDDDIGHPVKTWSTRDTVWGWIRPMSGRELMNANQPVGEITHKVTIRYYDSISIANRIKFGGRYFDINYIGDYDEKNEFMELLCKEMVGAVYKVDFDNGDSDNPVEKGDTLIGNDSTPGTGVCYKIKYSTSSAGTIWISHCTHQFVNDEVITGGGNTITVNGTPELV